MPQVQCTNTKKRQETIRALADSIYRTRQGFVVSSCTGNDKFLRVEILAGSLLPEKLSELGYRLKRCGSRPRLIPNAIENEVRDGYGRVIRKLVHAGEVPVELRYITLDD
jgi:hypothetical protein